MNIEQAIIDLTAAVNANTEALKQVLAQAGTTPAPEPAKKAKTKKVEAEPAPEPVVEPAADDPQTHIEAHNTVIETTVEPTTPEVTFKDQDDFIAKLTSKVQGIFASAGNAVGDKKTAYAALREQYGVKSAKELPETQWVEFWDAVGKM